MTLLLSSRFLRKRERAKQATKSFPTVGHSFSPFPPPPHLPALTLPPEVVERTALKIPAIPPLFLSLFLSLLDRSIDRRCQRSNTVICASFKSYVLRVEGICWRVNFPSSICKIRFKRIVEDGEVIFYRDSSRANFLPLLIINNKKKKRTCHNF